MYILIIVGQTFYEKEQEVTIIATGEKNKESYGNEVWLQGIEINNNPISDIEDYVISNTGWIQKDGALLATPNNKESILVIKYSNLKSLKIYFSKHNYSGKIKIINNNTIEKFDLYSPKGEEFIFSINSNISYYSVLLFSLAFILSICIILDRLQ